VAEADRQGSRVRLGEGREAEILEWDNGRALRLYRDSARQDRPEDEAAAMTAAKETGVPVPTVYDVIVVGGRRGLVMDRVDGTDLATALARRPWRLASSARELGELQARLHDSVAPRTLRDLREMLRDRIDTAPHLPPRLRAYAHDLLAALPDGDRVCHGDLHPGNVIVGRNGPVIIDWTNATRGDPMGDLARTVLMLRVGPLPTGMSPVMRAIDRLGRNAFRRLWVRGYQRARAVDTDLVGRWEAVCAAARLSEGIDEEVPPLLALLEEHAQRMP
jgi:aminoglycoside phosphotransferase (APT) family kinase protein